MWNISSIDSVLSRLSIVGKVQGVRRVVEIQEEGLIAV